MGVPHPVFASLCVFADDMPVERAQNKAFGHPHPSRGKKGAGTVLQHPLGLEL